MPAVEINNASAAIQPDQQLVAGRYRLQERIGSGRLGDIFSAIDQNYEALGVDQYVAIQIVSDIVARNNKLFNKLKTGYETLRAAAHPNIVSYQSFDRDGKFVYLGMELLDGASWLGEVGNGDAWFLLGRAYEQGRQWDRATELHIVPNLFGSPPVTGIQTARAPGGPATTTTRA